MAKRKHTPDDSVLRTLTVPVDFVLMGELVKGRYVWPQADDDAKKKAWREFKLCLHKSWNICSQASNWWIRQLAMRDDCPVYQEGKGGKTKVVMKALPDGDVIKELQHEARRLFPELDSQSLYSVLISAQKRYEKDRWNCLVRNMQSIASFRKPIPLPIETKDSPVCLDSDKKVYIEVRISGKKFRMYLKDDFRHAYQMRPIRLAASKPEIRGSIKLRENKKKQVLMSMPCYLPRHHGVKEPETVVLLRTEPDRFLVAEHGKIVPGTSMEDGWNSAKIVSNLFNLNEDQLKRKVEGHLRFLQRLSEDRKHERRQTSRQNRRNIQRRLEARCSKHADYMLDALHKIASVVAGHAKRINAANVWYDDSMKEFMPKFPYYRLKKLIEEKLDKFGIGFSSVKDQDDETEESKEE